MSPRLRRRLPPILMATILLAYLIVGGFYVLGERPNQDEGWYLEAARQVTAGKRPYLDFAYVQPPLLPYVYGVLDGTDSVAAGRRVSLLFGALAVLFVGAAGWRAGAVGGLTAAALLAFCPFALGQQSIVKAYALPNALMAAGLWLALGPPGRRKPAAGAAALLALAFLARNSVLPALLVYWLWLAARPERRRALPAALAAGLAVIALGLGPFLLADAGAVRFNLFEHHVANAPQADPLTLVLTMVAIGVVMAEACPFIALFAAGGLAGLARRKPEEAPCLPGIGLAALVAGLVYVGHFVSRHPYQEYQVLTLPALCVLAGLCWGELDRLVKLRRSLRVAVALGAGLLPLLLTVASVARLTGNQPIDGRVDPQGVHGPLRRVAALVDRYSGPSDPVLTFQTDVAIEAHRPLLPGLTLASFSFTDRPDAAAHHLVNPAILTDYLARRLPAVVVLSPGDLGNLLHGQWTPEHRVIVQPKLGAEPMSVYAPLLAALDANYAYVGEVPHVGQFAESFAVLARRAP